jgi:hypothetical protein
LTSDVITSQKKYTNSQSSLAGSAVSHVMSNRIHTSDRNIGAPVDRVVVWGHKPVRGSDCSRAIIILKGY